MATQRHSAASSVRVAGAIAAGYSGVLYYDEPQGKGVQHRSAQIEFVLSSVLLSLSLSCVLPVLVPVVLQGTKLSNLAEEAKRLQVRVYRTDGPCLKLALACFRV